PLVNCSACGRQISTEAESCPQCGHPNRAAPPVSTGPRCYACSQTATTRCQSCGTLSCAEHVQSIYIVPWSICGFGPDGGNELRCESCRASAATSNMVGWVIGGIIVVAVIAFIIFMSAKSDSDWKKDRWPFRYENAERQVCCVSQQQPGKASETRPRTGHANERGGGALLSRVAE